MNPLHYPSLELCEKLQEIGFSKTYATIVDLWNWTSDVLEESTYTNWYNDHLHYVCPSVMEMLDVMPQTISLWAGNNNIPLHVRKNSIEYHRTFDAPIKSIGNRTLPNALAEMILWLVENKYISFNK